MTCGSPKKKWSGYGVGRIAERDRGGEVRLQRVGTCFERARSLAKPAHQLGNQARKQIFLAGERLHAAWGAPERRYHDLGHLRACLHELDGANVEPPTADLVELSLWYHDAVYTPGARDNEERSAQLLATDAAALAIPAGTVRRAVDLVLATTHLHDPAPRGDRATDLIIDVDLSILGRDVLRFMDFEYSIEEEHAPSSMFAFRLARGRFLASLLASPSIFRTEYFRTCYERHARDQIRGLLASPRYRSYRWFWWLPIGWAAHLGRHAASRCDVSR